MIEIPAAEIVAAEIAGKDVYPAVMVFISPPYHEAWAVLRGKMEERKITQAYVKIGLPRKPRTTGHRSQNTHIHGHATEIGEFTGDYKEDVIAEAKRRAVTKGYPTRTNSFGHIVPESETVIDTTEAALLIDELHMIASTVGVVLKEYDE